MEQELTFTAETIEISGGRKLRNYRFEENGHALMPMRPEDVAANAVTDAEPSQAIGQATAPAGSAKPDGAKPS